MFQPKAIPAKFPNIPKQCRYHIDSNSFASQNMARCIARLPQLTERRVFACVAVGAWRWVDGLAFYKGAQDAAASHPHALVESKMPMSVRKLSTVAAAIQFVVHSKPSLAYRGPASC